MSLLKTRVEGNTTILRIAFLLCLDLFIGFAIVMGQQATRGASTTSLPYLDLSLPLEIRVKDLVSRLTLEEKISLLRDTAPAIPRLAIGSYNHGNEALHGVVRPGKFTVFPMAIGLASTWDPDLIHEMATAISDEARGRYNKDHGKMESGGLTKGVANGLLTFWSPTINMARDPRWGRTAETYGEDPYLTSQLAVAFIRGLQGDNPRYLKTVATPKHFAMNNEEYDRFKANAVVSESTLNEYYLPAFRAAITEGRAESIMTAYNAINGTPSTANHWLLTDLLRNQWNFGGYVVTDCGASPNLVDKFHFARTPVEGAAMALNAGVDLECWGLFEKNLAKAKEDGLVSSDSIDRAIGNVLRARFRLGMFDPPELVPYSYISDDVIGSPAHEQLALRAAQESLVLLKNASYGNKPLLPLDPKAVHSITVVGPYANVAELGDYSGVPIHTPVTPLDGIRAVIGQDRLIRYVPYLKPKTPNQEFRREVDAARHSDVAIAFLGFGTESGMEGKDRSNLRLSATQQRLIKSVVAANPRTIVVLVSGGPLEVEWISRNVPAVVEAWYPGERGGRAIADLLFGNINPAGRLPLTFYSSTNQLLDFHDYEIPHGRTYQYFRGEPLFPFGYGLSYSEFAYSNLRLDKTVAESADTIHATFDVTNLGSRDGDEVVQLYFRKNNTLSNRPLRQLGAFRRIAVRRNETVTVTLDLPVESLKVYSPELKQFTLLPGTVDLEVGASSADLRLTRKLTVEVAAERDQSNITERNEMVPPQP